MTSSEMRRHGTDYEAANRFQTWNRSNGGINPNSKDWGAVDTSLNCMAGTCKFLWFVSGNFNPIFMVVPDHDCDTKHTHSKSSCYLFCDFYKSPYKVRRIK